MVNVNEPAGDSAPYTPVVQKEQKSRGCLYGCLFVVIACIALTICTGVGGYWLFTGQVEKYTSTTPVELPTVDYEPEELAELEARVESFTEAFEADETPSEDLVLTAEEINALISKEEKLRGKVFVTVEDGQVSGDVSIPTDAIPGGSGRYFNGSARFDVAMESGVLIVTLVDAEVNGEPLPPQFIEAMSKENLAKDLYKDAETAKTLQKIESISVEDDKIILKVKREEPEEKDEAADEAVDEAASKSSDSQASSADAAAQPDTEGAQPDTEGAQPDTEGADTDTEGADSDTDTDTDTDTEGADSEEAV